MFLNWWAIGLGAAAVAAPLAVHFLARPKPIPFPLSTLKFLEEVIEQRRTRSRLRDILVLLLRALCIALLALALARPLLQERPMVSTDSVGETARVVVLDVSQSMAAGRGGSTAWNQAQTAALQFLDLGSGARANVVFAGARGRSVFDSLSPNLAALREAVGQAEVRAERSDPQAALELAGRLLGQAEGERLELVIISDFQRSNWGTLRIDAVPPDTNIQFHSVALEQSTGSDPDEQSTISNVAIEAVRFASPPIVGQSTMLEIDIANHSDQPIDVRCQADLVETQRELEGTIAPRSSRTLTTPIAFEQAGWRHGWVQLIRNIDSLPDDDQRPLAVQVRPPSRVLLVTRQPPNLMPSSSFYLERAFEVLAMPTAQGPVGRDGSDSGSASMGLSTATAMQPAAGGIQRVHPHRVAPQSWPEHDLLLLDHPGALGQAALRAIATRLRLGGGVLYVTSELVDATNLEQLTEMLGAEFQPPATLHPAAEGVRRKELFVTKLRSREPPFHVLGAENAAPLGAVKFGGGLATRRTEEGLLDQVLAELSDNSTLLYRTSVGAGQLAVLNADLGQSTWPIHASFLPVLSELSGALLAGSQESQAAYCGEPLVRLLPPEIDSAERLQPVTLRGGPPADDLYGQWEYSADQGCVVWRWSEPVGAGVYGLDAGDRLAYAVATAAPAFESDLRSLDRELITDRIAGERTVGYSRWQDDREGNDTAWSWLIVACLLGLLAEIATLRFNHM